uniref:GAR domain-containing protein n=1 Tax=Mesocestoides corti TaxID=53468 RepID=A0A5K3F596_MESCO
MTRNGHLEMRACSLPPENSVASSGYLPPKSCILKHNDESGQLSLEKSENAEVTGSKPKASNCDYLGLADDVFQGCSDCDLCSPVSADAANVSNKHSLSNCSIAFTDEDSGCQLLDCTNVLRAGPKCRMGRAYSVSTLDSPSIQSFNNKDEFLAAMTEDLADWMSRLYPEIARDLDSDNFFDRISDGVLLCHHANELHRLLEREFWVNLESGERQLQGVQVGGIKPILPDNPPVFQARGLSVINLAGGSFWARDNVANFILWCRAMRLPDSILFETEDLVSRKNLRSVIVCLLELARLGGRVGMEVPEIIYLEKEIDGEIALEERAFVSDRGTDPLDLPDCSWVGDTAELKIKTSNVSAGTEEEFNTSECSTDSFSAKIAVPAKPTTNRSTRTAMLREKKVKLEMEEQRKPEAFRDDQSGEDKVKKPRYNRPVVDMRTLDEIVREKLAQCTCEQTFPMIRLSEGRYLFGDKSTQIFVRILRNHVMVRVGGGWDTLDHFLQKYDECRKVQKPSNVFGAERRSNSKKTHPNSTDSSILDISNPTNILRAVSTDASRMTTSGEASCHLLGEGNLQVTKKGREVVYTRAAVPPYEPSKCSSNFHNPKEVGRCTNSSKIDLDISGGIAEKALSPSSSIEEFVPSTMSSPKRSIETMISMKENQKEALFTQNSGRAKTGLISPASSIEDLQSIPVIDQVVSRSDGGSSFSRVKPTPGKKAADVKSDQTLSSPNFKRGSGPSNKRIFNPSGPVNANRQRATSTHNLSQSGTSPRSTLGKFSKSTASLSDSFSSTRPIKPIASQVDQRAALNAAKRAKSTSNLVSASPASNQDRQTTDSSKLNVFDRLSGSTSQRSNIPKLATPPATPIKKQKYQPEYTKAPTVRRRNSSATAKRVAQREERQTNQKTPMLATGKQETPQILAPVRSNPTPRRASVARMPAEGTRIPRPVKILTVTEGRSKSVGSNLHPKRGSVA